MSIRLWLVRHGATDWSDAGRLNGWSDVPLNDRGRVQARLLRRHLAQREFTGVWSSDLVRAAHTARLALGEPVLEPRLRELDFGHLEGKRWEELPAAVRGALLEFEGFEAPGGESTTALRQRVVGFLRGLPGGEQVLFTHGGVIRVLLREAGRDARVAPGELLQLRLNGRGDRRFVLIEKRLP
jgi:probable phosphoglycerate mutase